MGTHQKARPVHVLLATDLSPAAMPHVEFAVRFADALGARTTLFHAAVAQAVIVEPALYAAPVPLGEDLGVTRRRLQEMTAAFDTVHPVHVAVEATADARASILEAAERIHADLVILPTHGRTGLKRALLGSTAEQVLRRSKRPVLLVTDRMLHLESRVAAKERPVLLATDLSSVASAAHGSAVDLARRLGLSLLVASVLPAREPPAGGGGAPVAPLPVDPQLRVQDRCKQLREIAVSVGSDLHVEVLAEIDDDPAGAIVKMARAQQAAFLVLGTHARRGVARALKGSIAEDVVRHATVPVLCVPAHED